MKWYSYSSSCTIVVYRKVSEWYRILYEKHRSFLKCYMIFDDFAKEIVFNDLVEFLERDEKLYNWEMRNLHSIHKISCFSKMPLSYIKILQYFDHLFVLLLTIFLLFLFDVYRMYFCIVLGKFWSTRCLVATYKSWNRIIKIFLFHCRFVFKRK